MDAAQREPWSRRARASAALTVAVIVLGSGALTWYAHRHRHPPPASADAHVARAPYAPTTVFAVPGLGGSTKGGIDRPVANNVIATKLDIAGWSTDPAGILGVDIRVNDATFAAHAEPPSRDPAAQPPYMPGAFFAFAHDFAPMSLERHEVTAIAVNARNEATVLGRRSLVAPQAMALWSGELDRAPALADQPFWFLMATSGVAFNGAKDVDREYAGLTSRTQRVGVAVPVLYMRTTKGAAGDFAFDPAFDLTRKCHDRPVADDNLESVIAFAVAQRVPVNFILNGGIWASASCYSPEWDLATHLEENVAHDQWDQFGKVMPGDYRKGLPGSTESPLLSRSLTYNVYDAVVRRYKRRNLAAAASLVADFARAHPDLFVGVSLDADTYMNPFVEGGRRYDYNPGMLRQFREWLAGGGPYAGASRDGAPDLTRYRREHPLSLADVNRLAHQHWSAWSQVEPPRTFRGSALTPVGKGETPFWDDPWYHEWDVFRRHVVQVHYAELAQWVHDAGIPVDRIFSAQAVTPHSAWERPVATYVTSPSQYFDSAGVSIEGAKPPDGHIGVILYGPAAENTITMGEGHNLFATIGRFDDTWAAAEMNATDLRKPKVLPTYAQSYHAFRDLFNYGARQASLMAWNGSSGLIAGRADYLAYTSWRSTPGEQAMMDFLVSHADVPRGALLWTFGSPRLVSDDGWTATDGTFDAAQGALVLHPRDNRVVLRSPTDQLIRPARIARLLLRLEGPASVGDVGVRARLAGDATWRDVAHGTGNVVAFDWPQAWRSPATLVEQIEIALTLAPGSDGARLTRVLLYPGAP